MPTLKSPATMFTPFPDLPSELRVKIWHYACFHRTLTLTYSTSDSFHCTSPAPVLLSTNRESRHEALKIYTLFFGTKTHPAKTYFNPYFDTLYLPRYREMGYDETLRDFRELAHDPSGLLAEARCIAVDHVDIEVKRPWEAYNKASLLRGFRKLEKIIVVLNDEAGEVDNAMDGEVEFQEPKLDPERLLRIWYCFRQSFMMEEKALEDVCRDIEMEFLPYSLPTVRIRAKSLKPSRVKEAGRSMQMQAAMDGLQL